MRFNLNKIRCRRQPSQWTTRQGLMVGTRTSRYTCFDLFLTLLCGWSSSRVISRSNLRPSPSNAIVRLLFVDLVVCPPPSFVVPQSWMLNFLLDIISSRLDDPAPQTYDFHSETAPLEAPPRCRCRSLNPRPTFCPYSCEPAFKRLRRKFRLEKADAILSIFRIV